MKKPRKINKDLFDDKCYKCDHYVKGRCTGREWQYRNCLNEIEVIKDE